MKISNSKIRIALSVLCLGIVLGVIAGYSASPSATMWITGGLYPHGIQTVFVEGSNYFAKDGYGQLQSSTNATALFLSIITDRVKIFVSEGFYTLTSQLLITNDYVTIEFETGTRINFTGSFSPCILIDSALYTTLKSESLVVFYNDGGATDRVMLEINQASYGLYEGLYFHGVNATGCVGLHLYAQNGEGNSHNDFKKMWLWRCATSILFNYSGSGWNNRNYFYNIVTNLGTLYGVRMIGNAMTGNTFVNCEFAHHDIGLSYEGISSGGNHFLGCTWDTNDIIAIDKPHNTHRGLKVIGATLWHTGTGEAVNGTWQYGDHFTAISGDAYSEFIGDSTISSGNTNVVISYDAWQTPFSIIITPTSSYEGKAIFVSASNSTHATISLSSSQATDVDFMYRITVFP